MVKALFYSWNKVLKYNAYNETKLLNFFSKRVIPKELSGNSFILNTKDLILSKYFLSEKIDYIYLCSIRNFFDYNYSKEAGLFLYFSPISIEKIKTNRLLTIKDDYIKFKYEEINYGN